MQESSSMNFSFKIKISFSLILLLSIIYSCSDAEAKQKKSKSNVFENIDKRDKKLFTRTERINSYNKSVSNLNTNEKSLSKNANYSGYGSLNNKNSKKEINKTSTSKTKKLSRPKISNAGFSAYSTN